MSAVGHPLKQSTELHLVNSTSRAEEATQSARKTTDDGLGCFRGFAFVMLCNIVFVLLAVAVWGLWRLLR